MQAETREQVAGVTREGLCYILSIVFKICMVITYLKLKGRFCLEKDISEEITDEKGRHLFNFTDI